MDGKSHFNTIATVLAFRVSTYSQSIQKPSFEGESRPCIVAGSDITLEAGNIDRFYGYI